MVITLIYESKKGEYISYTYYRLKRYYDKLNRYDTYELCTRERMWTFCFKISWIDIYIYIKKLYIHIYACCVLANAKIIVRNWKILLTNQKLRLLYLVIGIMIYIYIIHHNIIRLFFICFFTFHNKKNIVVLI